MASNPARSLHASNGLRIDVLANACVGAIERGGILINQIVASPVAGGVGRLYLRAHGGDAIAWAEIVGPGADSTLAAASDRFVWSGAWRGLSYRCTLRLRADGDAWFWHVDVENRAGASLRCDAILVQDVGLAARGQVRNNELYTSQYLDHVALRHAELGHIVVTRQNLPQAGGAHPWLMQGCFPAARGFTTDGFDFFESAYRGDGVPRALARPVIGERVRQYETAYVAIQSSDVELPPARAHAWTFFAHYLPDHPEPSSAADLARVPTMNPLTESVELLDIERDRSVFQSCALFPCDDFGPSDVERHWPGERRHDDGGSFFHDDDARHIVLKSKELAVARPHGHVMRAGRGLMPDDEVMSATCYAAGVFASQLALANASLAKLLSGVRDPLNVVRSNGLRIFVREDSNQPWKLLGVPSAFEMAIDGCRWIYQRGDARVTVTCAASEGEPKFTYDVRADGAAFEVFACGEIAAGPAEYDAQPRVSLERQRGRITVRPDEQSLLGRKQPEIAFHIDTSETIGGDELLFDDQASRGLPYFTLRSRGPTNALTFMISGTLGQRGDRPAAARCAFPVVRIPSAPQLQDTLTWFARDALVHLCTPRGLEQPNGGAWGVRDVCQGPVEFLLSYDRADAVREIVRAVFARQYARRGDWPQWFMFPPFQEIQSAHAHGDVVIWPLKALCDYLEHSNDDAILYEHVPYADDETFAPTPRTATILEHCDRAIARMREQFLPGVALPRYGDGDWDDSLQPADKTLRERMASAWTAELTFQTLRRYADALAHFGERDRAAAVNEMAGAIEIAFRMHMMPGGVVTGFAVFENARPVEYLLHPSDTRTGLRYRLIPMTRGILSGIFSREQAEAHLGLIREHLLYPDGARLMDRPAEYCGGVERTFRRSESAAFFGREIGLQYVHAHLRYAEALAKMGRADELWRALLVVNPIAVTDVVKNARPRQRNCYFSSSDAAFVDRYEASRDYAKLRRGEVPVDGGWRIYSSGPGIYTNLIIRHLFGLRRHFDFVEFDPVLPAELDGAVVELTERQGRMRYQFTKAAQKRVTVNGRLIKSQIEAQNGYRPGGLRVERNAFEAALTAPENVISVEY